MFNHYCHSSYPLHCDVFKKKQNNSMQKSKYLMPSSTCSLNRCQVVAGHLKQFLCLCVAVSLMVKMTNTNTTSHSVAVLMYSVPN